MARNLTPEQKLKRAHVQLVRSKQFALLSGILLLGKSEIRSDLPMPTACTDGRNKYYHPELIDEISEKQLAFAVAHENFHVLYKHTTTWKHLYKENAMMANMACDYVINAQIKALDPNCDVVEINENWLYHQKYEGWDTFRVYKDLMKNGAPNNDSADGSGQPTGKAGKYGTGDGQGPQDHHDWEAGDALDDKQKKELEKAIDSAIRQGEILAGKVGGNSARDIGAIPEPQVNWREQLREFVAAVADGKDCATWRKPNRRWMANDIYMPTTYSETIGPMVVAIDTSGSIDQHTINTFLGELTGIVEMMPPEKLHLLYWDTNVAAEEVYEPGMYEMLVQSTKPGGGGGTDPLCVQQWLQDHPEIEPSVVLFLSDGYVGRWPSINAPTMWGMITDVVAPEGVTIKIDVER